ncbi:radical SAM protein [Halanaerocella petrolearia]
MSKQNYIIPVFVPHFGCPHDCVFCNQEEITGINSRITAHEVDKQIDEYLTTIPKSARQVEVAFYGGSFTGISREYQKELLSVANNRLQQGGLTGIRLSTRPDYITNDILDFLQNYGVTTIELGVQSLDNQVLNVAGRGHNRSDVLKAVGLIKEYQFKLGLQVMPGLPGSDLESDLQTAKEIIELGPDFTRIYPTLIIKGTELERLYHQGEYQPLELSAAVELTAKILVEFKAAKIPVIRVGLQPSDGVSQEEVVAGPFHPSFRQLVEARLMLKKIVNKLADKEYKELTLVVNPKDISNLRGQKNRNVTYLEDNYKLEEINIEVNEDLARGEVEIQ